ncbi:putative methyltransferase [Caballeronia temeraria]|uniref:site-specific DNA-methyltransferase (adenine-specific) n=1 Tax=Caballeronia temeraria TaxID=1777137 RepID=A0A158BYH7_9BURK|nr:DNA methyltransferase [Caballeronia temeraria]SAK75040.1 putative methyltransferase [Caballeronia temeraria]
MPKSRPSQLSIFENHPADNDSTAFVSSSNACGRLLRERRQEKGLSLTSLAETIGIAKSHLSMLESGQRQPTDEQFDSLSVVLEVPADLLRVTAGRLPPDVANAVPGKADAIVSVIRREDSGAKVTFPRHLSEAFKKSIQMQAGDAPPAAIGPYLEHVRAGKNSQAYRAHSYHTKVPPEAIDKLIRHHTKEGHVVADPFCGSGMTGVASILAGRNAVLSDLSPAAVHIAQNYVTPCDPEAFLKAAARVIDRVRPTLSWLYETGTTDARTRVEYTVWSDIFECRHCGGAITYWEGARDSESGAVLDAVTCPACRRSSQKRELRWIGERPVETNAKGPTSRGAHPPTSAELELIERASAGEVLYWIPQIPFTADREMWRAGHAAQGVTSVADFYTKRNLHALGAIRHTIQEEKDDRLRSALLFAFTGMVNRASKRYQWNVKRPTNVMTGTLYISSLRYEWNVGSLFERKVRDVARYFKHLGTPTGRAEVVRSSATELCHLPDSSIDYVFMDPPFGSNIFYADSSLLWDAWLGTLTDEREEIVVNKHRSTSEGGKTISDYQRLMTTAFQEVARILKPSAYATLQFNNSSDEVWCAIQDALSDAGLEVRHAIGLDKIHPSIKGVKGRQAKENVASLDALIELRRRPAITRKVVRNLNSDQMIVSALVEFSHAQKESFTTDQAFSFLVRSSLKDGNSLNGLSLQSVKELCARLFDASGSMWRQPSRAVIANKVISRNFDVIDSPFGCAVERHLAGHSYLAKLVDLERPAPDASGDPPNVVSGQRNTALYNAHSYHTKVPPEAIIPFIKHFTRPGDVVLDPFCGTGMTGVAAQLSGRRAVLNDLSVAAAHLAYNHTRPCDPRALQDAFDKIAADLDAEFREIYACTDGGGRGYIQYTLWSRDAICPHCQEQFSIWESIDRQTGRMPSTLTCPRCGEGTAKQALKYAGNRPVLLNYQRANGQRVERAPTPEDVSIIEQQAKHAPTSWYPSVEVDPTREMYIRSALHLQGVKRVADFYMPRNLRALSSLWNRIQQVSDERVRSALLFAFTNTAWHGTRMRRFNARGGQRPLTGTLYIPQLSSEANVLSIMRNKIRQLRSYYESLGTPSELLPAIRLGSATKLSDIPNDSVDYVFTDPPFGSNLFYADCNLIWESWLGGLTRQQEEAVVNRSRDQSKGGKTVGDYESLMTQSMREIFRVLKPGAWATLVFHSTDPAVWRAIQSAAEAAGFQIEDAGALDRKQQSHKGYKGRSEKEDVAHFDVIMSMRKRITGAMRNQRSKEDANVEQLVLEAFHALSPKLRTVQRVHSEVIQRLARHGLGLDVVSFDDVKKHMPRSTSGSPKTRDALNS